MSKKWNVLDNFLSRMRYGRVLPFMRKDKVVADIGCGKEGLFLRSISHKIKSGYGFDFKLKKESVYRNITLVNGDFVKHKGKFDVVIMMAVLEHLDHPLKILKQIHRKLNKGGVVLLTTPDKRSKWILEFLAFDLGIINKEEILDHKHYFNRKELFDIMSKAGFSKIKHKHFQCGLNNFVLARKD